MMQQISQVNKLFPSFRSASNGDRCAIQFALELSELSISALEENLDSCGFSGWSAALFDVSNELGELLLWLGSEDKAMPPISWR